MCGFYTSWTRVSQLVIAVQYGWPAYDYSRSGAYFLTIVAHQKARLFGHVEKGAARLNGPGHMVEAWWLEVARKFPCVALDAHVVMPNHFHGILILDAPERAAVRSSDELVERRRAGGPLQDGSVPQVVQWFKTMTTNAYIRGVKTAGWKPFRGRLWQRNYYDHVIRNEADLDEKRKYIMENPLKWAMDAENPETWRR